LEKIDQSESWEALKTLRDSMGIAESDSLSSPVTNANLELLRRGLDTSGLWREELLFRSPWEDEYMRKLTEEEE